MLSWPVRACCRHRQLFLPLLVLRLQVPFVHHHPHHRLATAVISMSTSSSSTPSRPAEVMQVKRLSENAVLPVRGSAWAAGYDLASAEDTVVPARGKALVKTDLSIAIPINTYARVAPRSGLAWKKFIDVGAGVIDYDYRGPVGVVLFNHGDTDFDVKKGDRVAQLILERISMADVVEVDELSETARGSGGFGSTGVSKAPSPSGDDGQGVKRLRQEEEGPADGGNGSTVTSLLTALGELSQEAEGDKSVLETISKCKPLAFDANAKLVSAMAAYDATKNKADLIDTLNIIIKQEEEGVFQ